MRMLPSTASTSTESAAERRVFDLLKATDLGKGSRAYHSLTLSEHDYKRVGELDFVVLCREGLLVLEVKGGGVALRDGIWYFRDRFGVEHRRSEGPFRQAASGMFALERRIREELGPDVLRHLVLGHGVIFTDCSFRERSVEWADEIVADADRLRGQRDLARFLKTLLAYWSAKSPGRAVGANGEMLEAIGRFLRPDFDRVPSLRHRAEELDVAMERLTEEQYSRLDLIEQNPRILCTGGAGTGKTFLAVELAKRHATRGEAVLLTTSSPQLAAFIRSRVPSERVTVCIPDDQLPRGKVAESLIVDEGQDLLNFETLDRLDQALVGGLAHGCWRIFLDVNKQTGLLGNFDPDALEMLRSYGAVMAGLRVNCRNTRQIATYTKLLTAADLGIPSAGDGPKIGVSFFHDEAEEAALVDAELRRLSEEGIPPSDITILSPLPLRDSCARFTTVYSRRRLRQLDAAAAAAWPVPQTTYATIPEFKGLENRFILLVDVHTLDEAARDVNLLYVAMSRARAGLWMAVDGRLRARLKKAAQSRLDAVIEDSSLLTL